MAKTSKRHREATKIVDPNKTYKLDEALKSIYSDYKGKVSSKKITESINITFSLNSKFNSSKDSENGSFVLPSGFGNKVIRVVAFVPENMEQEAIAAGAEIANIDALVKKIMEGWTEFDVAIATPDVVARIAKVAKVLGPRGLMPSAKNGMLTKDFVKVIKEAKSGVAMFKANKSRCINFKIGSLGLTEQQLKANIELGISSVKAAAKDFVATAYISPTFGPAWKISLEV